MKKLFTLFMGVLCYFSSFGVPACPVPAKVVQPDGSEITVINHGDEFVNWTTTSDSYTVVRDNNGYYVYAMQSDGVLVPTNVKASDKAKRTANELKFLKGVEKNLVPTITNANAKMRAVARDKTLKSSQKEWDYSKFRGLVVLVEYNDCSFIRDDAQEIFNDMINKENYDGFMSDAKIPTKEVYTGSVHDYFSDNSYGLFKPKFDVVGPVKVNYSQYYAHGTDSVDVLIRAAVKAADKVVDFSKYDTDGDREVDMVYFIFAGGGANYSGNDSRLIWPHKYATYGYYDGVSMGTYACSTELAGRPSSKIIEGIGTICHEFGHVIGLMDAYDTDYDGSGGLSNHPGAWSIMAGGSYNNGSRTPVGYTLLEKYQTRFMFPTTITEEGNFKLEPIETNKSGYKIKSAVRNEFFLLENRQRIKWDTYLPGHGMLVFRVDSTDVNKWETNTVNCNPRHNYFELLRAKPQNTGQGKSSDPFPGTENVSFITNDTSPNLKSWSGLDTPFTIEGIAEDEDGLITFSAEMYESPTEVEDFEDMDITTGDVLGIKGKFCNWTLTSSKIVDNNLGYSDGRRCVSSVKKAQIMTSEINSVVKQISFDIYNSSSSSAIFNVYSSIDQGATWTALKTLEGLESVSAGMKTKVTPIYTVRNSTPIMFRIVQVTGSSTSRCYIDNVSFKFSKTTGVDEVSVNPTMQKMNAYVADGVLVVSSVREGAVINVYDVRGAVVASTTVQDGVATINLSNKGFYIVSDGVDAKKVIY